MAPRIGFGSSEEIICSNPFSCLSRCGGVECALRTIGDAGLMEECKHIGIFTVAVTLSSIG